MGKHCEQPGKHVRTNALSINGMNECDITVQTQSGTVVLIRVVALHESFKSAAYTVKAH